MNYLKSILALLIALLQLETLQAQARRGEQGDNRLEPIFNTIVPSQNYNLILARPTANSVTLSILSKFDADMYIAYYEFNKEKSETLQLKLKASEPKEIVLSNLKPATKYCYTASYKPFGTSGFERSAIYHFQTQRKSNEAFIFTITADSHLDQNSDTLVYKTTLRNALSDSADFHIDLGDTYMTDKYRANYKDAFPQYLAQRYYFGLLCHSSPLFFVQGNHDGESGQRLNGSADNMTVWSNLTRKKYFPNPVPDGFYSGNDTDEPFVGKPQNYYAWEWGNALFIVLDPFWYTPRTGNDNLWERTLGVKQYNWLKGTLEKSKATYRFVFIHNLVGGVDIKGRGRGGVEVAKLYEWGGQNPDGSDGFAEHRQGWEMPIHQLFVKNKVTAVFHGHDHLYARQELDGIIYQCLPQPGAMDMGKTRQAGEYGYLSGDIYNAPGYARISITSNAAKLEFIGTDTKDKLQNKRVIRSFAFRKQ